MTCSYPEEPLQIYPANIFKDLHCQSATSRVFDDKGVFQKVSKSDATEPPAALARLERSVKEGRDGEAAVATLTERGSG